MNDNSGTPEGNGASHDFFRCLPLFVWHEVHDIRCFGPQGRHLLVQLVGGDSRIRVTEYCFCPWQ